MSIVSLERQIALIYIAHDQVRFGPDRVSRHHISLPSSVLTYSSPDGYIYIFLFSRGLGREGHLGRSMTAKGCVRLGARGTLDGDPELQGGEGLSIPGGDFVAQ